MKLLDLLFPVNCLECGKGERYMCVSCVEKVQFANTLCPVCAKFSFYGNTHASCGSTHSLNGAVSLWEHKGVIKKGISEIKYKFAYNVVNEVAFYAAIEAKKFKLLGNSILVSVPLFLTRENWRGFNQAEKLANQLAEKLGLRCVPGLLVRSMFTTPQVHLHKKKRLRNIRGKIAVNTTILKEIDKKSPLIIVDDVWTTGATIKECAKVLKKAGAVSVWGLTIARA